MSANRVAEIGKEYSIGDLLYWTKCTACGYVPEWEANFDADGTSYTGKCCGKVYYAVTSKLTLIDIFDEEEE